MSTPTKDLYKLLGEAATSRAHVTGSSPTQRADWLEAVAEALDAHGQELIDLAEAQTNLPAARLTGELARTTFQLRLLAQVTRSGDPLEAAIDHADPDWGMGPRPDLRRVNSALGVVAVFGASNFPFAFSVMGGDTASALAAGCPVVHKVHEAHEELGLRTAEIAQDALIRAGAPKGLFAVVTGREAGMALVQEPMVRAVAFTGSTAIGRHLLDQVNARPEPIPFYGELGSINPVVVTQRAWATRREEILRGFVESFTLGMGQFCTKPGVVILPTLTEEDREFLRDAVTSAARFPMLTPALAAGYTTAAGQVFSGLELVSEAGEQAPLTGLYATTDKEVAHRPELIREEVFGPAALLVQYDDERGLGPLLHSFEGQLTATIHAETDELVGDLIGYLSEKAGRVLWGGWPTGVTVSHAQQHGGPYPASTAAGTTSVGTAAIGRFTRPVAYQSMPDHLLPPSLQEANPWGLTRRVDGQLLAGSDA